MAFSFSYPAFISKFDQILYFRKDSDPDYGYQTVDDIYEIGWKFLPYPVLVEIFYSLDDGDRFNMALVCKNWQLAFSDPSLWRVREFRFGGIRATNRREVDSSLRFLKTFGQHLRSLCLTCEHPTPPVAKSFQKAMKDITG